MGILNYIKFGGSSFTLRFWRSLEKHMTQKSPILEGEQQLSGLAKKVNISKKNLQFLLYPNETWSKYLKS